MAQKSTSHFAPQPYANQSVFKSLLNCSSEMYLSRKETGREIQREVQRRKNSCLRDAYVFSLWHTSRHQRIAVIGDQCQSRADNLQPGTVEAGRVMPCTQDIKDSKEQKAGSRKRDRHTTHNILRPTRMGIA